MEQVKHTGRLAKVRWRALARDITEGASHDHARVLALERFFKRDGGFRYSLNTPNEIV